MELHALLIGINDYPNSAALNGCLKDIAKIETYLQSTLVKKHFGGDKNIHIKTLTDEQAQKEKVIAQINSIGKKAKDNDVVLIYYSGHGAQEKTEDLFSDEHDGLLECMVCHPSSKNGYFLADKEIRYLLAQFKKSPHLLTIFDCCHAGDITKAGRFTKEETRKQIKRISNIFEQRPYEQFCFSEAITVQQLSSKRLADIIPHKNHIHIAACLSSESSWENRNGGIFTQYLLDLLNASKSQLSYQEIERWASISMIEVTNERQTPVVSIQGQGKLNSNTPWLNFKVKDKTKKGFAAYNKSKGWHYNQGALFGIKKGMQVQVEVEAQTIKSKVARVYLNYAELEDAPFENSAINTKKKYNAYTKKTNTSPLNIFINNLDNDDRITKELTKILQKKNNIHLTNGRASHFDICIFNQLVYFTMPDDPYRPISKQLDALDENRNLSDYINDILKSIHNWHHLKTLYNPETAKQNPPIKIEIKPHNTNEWIDITESQYTFEKHLNRAEAGLYHIYKTKITNVSNQDKPWYIGALILAPDMGIYTNPFAGETIALKKGESKIFNEHLTAENENSPLIFTNYMEVYNWPKVSNTLKFIYSNRKFNIKKFAQPELPAPLTIEDEYKGPVKVSQLQPKKVNWGTCQATVSLKNANYNIISGQLKKNWQAYIQHVQLAPFIAVLYYETDLTGGAFEVKLKLKRQAQIPRERSLMGQIVNIANQFSDFWRYRKFLSFKSSNQQLPTIVAEGDSWFLFPLLVTDTIDHLMNRYPIRSLAAAGDTLKKYKTDGDLIKAVQEEKPQFVLISGGGNDIIGPEIKDILCDNTAAGQAAEDYVNVIAFEERIFNLKSIYLHFSEEIEKINPNIKIFLHGYDYIRANPSKDEIEDGWANKHMIAQGITKAKDRQKVIRYLIDTFNEMLAEIAEQRANLFYVNMRGKVRKDEWYDEIHPDKYGYKKIADAFMDAIETEIENS